MPTLLQLAVRIFRLGKMRRYLLQQVYGPLSFFTAQLHARGAPGLSGVRWRQDWHGVTALSQKTKHERIRSIDVAGLDFRRQQLVGPLASNYNFVLLFLSSRVLF